MVSQFAQNDVNKCNEIARPCPSREELLLEEPFDWLRRSHVRRGKSGLFPMSTR